MLSGMERPEQLAENLPPPARPRPAAYAQGAGLVEEARVIYPARMQVPCTTCGYCAPCPSGVAIADVFTA